MKERSYRYFNLVTAIFVTTLITANIMAVKYEIIATPLTYGVVGALKRAEHEDYYDTDTNFNPFRLNS